MVNTKPSNASEPIDGKSAKPSGDTIGTTENARPDDNGNASQSIDPTTLAGGAGNFGERYERDDDGNIIRNVDGTPRKKRGRKPTTNSGRKPATASAKPKASAKSDNTLVASVDSLAQTIGVLHLGIAGLLQFPDFALDDDEAKVMANATANVLEQFSVEPNPKVTAVVGLVSACGQIYIPRYYLWNIQKEQKEKEKPKEGQILPDKKQPDKKGGRANDVLSNPSNFNLGG